MARSFDPTTLIPKYLLASNDSELDGRVSGSSGVFDGGRYAYKTVQWTSSKSTGSSFEMTFQTGDFEPHSSKHNRRLLNEANTETRLIEPADIKNIQGIDSSSRQALVIYQQRKPKPTSDKHDGHLHSSKPHGLSDRLSRQYTVETAPTDDPYHSNSRHRKSHRHNSNLRLRNSRVRRRKKDHSCEPPGGHTGT